MDARTPINRIVLAAILDSEHPVRDDLLAVIDSGRLGRYARGEREPELATAGQIEAVTKGLLPMRGWLPEQVAA